MEPDFSSDICVIGGGPAGSVIARQLAKLGHSVCMVEKAAFPRPHVGICLSETTGELLAYLGMLEEITRTAALRQRKNVLVKWDMDDAILTHQPGMNVDRGEFDRILIRNAQSAGVRVFQPAENVSMQRLYSGGWKISFKTEKQTISIRSQFLVDASGRSNALQKKFVRYAPALFALHAHWELGSEPSCDGSMEAGESSWLWTAYLGNRKAMVSLYTDPKSVAESGGSIEDFYLNSLKQFSTLNQFDRISIVDKIIGCDASSRYSTEAAGRDFIRVGDASLCVDPMASQGIHLAISSGIQAAVVVNTLLRSPETAAVALDFYSNSQQGQIDRFGKRTAEEYSRALKYWNGAFWQNRSMNVAKTERTSESVSKPEADRIVQLCPEAQFLSTPVMQDDFIVSLPALHHPGLQQPVAYLGGVYIVSLLEQLQSEMAVQEITSLWAMNLSDELSLSILEWLWQHRILI